MRTFPMASTALALFIKRHVDACRTGLACDSDNRPTIPKRLDELRRILAGRRSMISPS